MANQLSLPDSTRLASKYALPRIKFAGTKNKGKLVAPVEQLPVGLSRLIERQIQVNASALLRQANRTSLAPTTSVSKTVRIKANDTSGVRITIVSSSLAKELDLKREPAVSSTKLTTTTPPPLTISVTSSSPTTGRPNKLAPVETTTTTAMPTSTMDTAGSSPVTLLVESQWPTTSARPTEPGDPYKSLPTPRVSDEHQSGNSNLVGDDEDSIRMATKKGQLAGRAPKQPVKHPLSQAAGPSSSSNIKLFHFKRKPDMNKLPFYKRPLNYTELGWTNEQIQEHLDSLATGDQATSRTDSDTQLEQGGAESQLLRRKRRGKSQFEKLIAELHGDLQTADESASQSDLVPVQRRKAEPIVVKPVFSVMNQKTRSRATTSSEAPTLASSTTSSPPERQESTGNQMAASPAQPADKDDEGIGSARNKSKPIIRMRRKHHGEQPSIALGGSGLDQQPWRPSKPLVWSPLTTQVVRAADNSEPARLLLVPSGLLTPSGSHLVPLYSQHAGSGSDAAASAAGLLHSAPAPSWPQASNDGWSVPVVGTSSLLPEEQPANGAGQSPMVAPKASALESQLTSALANQQKALQAGAQPAVNPPTTSGELRVPKLLVKPMRPAKYSLNGYIPKPSLNQQASQANHPELGAVSHHSHQTGTGAQQVARVSALTKPTSRQPASRPGSHQGSLVNGKDLVSLDGFDSLTWPVAGLSH